MFAHHRIILFLAILFAVNWSLTSIVRENQELDLGAAPPVLVVAQGGTGAASHTSGECLVGNGTGAITTQTCGSGNPFAWTPVAGVGVSTSTLTIHGAGLISQASSTIVGDLTVTENLIIGTTQWDDGSNQIDGEQVADGTLDFDSADHSITLAGNPGLAASQCYWGASGIVCEGSTANDFEALFTVTNPTADRTYTFPNSSITVAGLASAMTGTFDGNNFAGGAIAQNQILYGSAAGTLSELTVASSSIITSNGTNVIALAGIFSEMFADDDWGDVSISSGAATIDNVSAGAYAAASIDGDDVNSNIAGRSLSLTSASPDTLDVDTELYTKTFTFEMGTSSLSTTTAAMQHSLPHDITITRISCNTDQGTTTLQIDERLEETPNTAGTDILSSPIACGSGHSNTTTSFSNAGITGNDLINLDIDETDDQSGGATPTFLRFTITYTIDD